MRKQNLRNKLALHTECTSLQKRSYTTYYIMTYTKYSTRNGLETGKGKEHLLGSVKCTEFWGTKLEWSCCASAIQLIKLLSALRAWRAEVQKFSYSWCALLSSTNINQMLYQFYAGRWSTTLTSLEAPSDQQKEFHSLKMSPLVSSIFRWARRCTHNIYLGARKDKL